MTIATFITISAQGPLADERSGASVTDTFLQWSGLVAQDLHRWRCGAYTASQSHTAIEEHESILDALQARDGQTLARVLRAHLGSTWAKVSDVDSDEP